MKFPLLKFLLLLLPILISLKIDMTAQNKIDPAAYLPENINGWETGGDRTFNEETLYNYIDGGAELFLSFGFTKVFNRIYTCENQAEIIVDIFFMNTSYDAFGVFSHSAGKIEHEFGQQSQTLEGAVIFWKDNIYVSIMSSPETPESKTTITELARIIEESIPYTGKFPSIIEHLPQKYLAGESIRYFRHYIWQNASCFISNENILNIDQNTQCISAQYNDSKNKAVLLLIRYSSINDVSIAKDNFIKNYNAMLLNNSIIKAKNSKWVGIKSHNSFFIVVLNGTSENFVEYLINTADQMIID